MIRKRFFVALIAVGMMICTFVAQAEIKTYTGVGEDYANQFETQEDAKLRAKRIAIEDAKKHAGVGIKTYSRSINSELVDDEISTITSNSYKIVGDVKYEKILKPLTDRITVIVWRATVDVDVDDSEVKAWARRTADEKKALINRNRAAEEAFNAAIQTAEDLNKRAAEPLTEIEEFDLRHEVEALNNDFQVNQKIEDGNRLNYEDKPAEAIEKYGEALETKFVDGVGEYTTDFVESIETAKNHARERAEKNAREKVGVSITTNSNGEVETTMIPLGDVIEVSYKLIPQKYIVLVRANVKIRYNKYDVDKWVAEQKQKIKR